MIFATILHSPILRGVLSGALAAAVVDLHAFMTWRTPDEARTYAWGTALLRWVQGAVTGGLTTAGLGTFL